MSRLVVSGAALIAVSYGLARFGLGAFVPELRAAFGLSGTGIGLVMGASFAGYVVALAAAGRLLRSWGVRRVVLASGFTATGGLLGVAAATHPVLLAGAALVGGLSTGWSSTGLATAVEEQVAAPRRAGAQTIINAATSLGLMFAAPVAVAVGVAWRAACLVFGLIAAVATIAAVRAVAAPAVAPLAPAEVPAGPDHAPGGPGSVGAPASASAPRPATVGRRRFRPGLTPRLTATAVLLGVTTALFWSFGRELVVDTTAATDEVARLAWLVLGGGGLLGGLAGRATRRIGLPAAVALGWVGLVTAYLLLGIGQASVPVAAVAVAAFGAGYMALTGLVIVWSVRVRPGEPGAAVARGFLLLAIGQAAASPVVGLAVDMFGLAAVSRASAVFAVAGLAVLMAPRADQSCRRGTPRPQPPGTGAAGRTIGPSSDAICTVTVSYSAGKPSR